MKYASYINLKLLKHFDQDEFNRTATIDHKGVAQFVYELPQQKLKELTVAAVWYQQVLDCDNHTSWSKKGYDGK